MLETSLKKPIFVGGMFKSGTTLLRAMLGKHKNLSTGLETYWFSEDWNSSERLKWTSKFFDLEESMVSNLVASTNCAEEFLSKFMEKICARDSNSRWVEKTPGNASQLNRIFDYWPEAYVIHIVRDPRDVYASLRQSKHWDTPDQFADRWCDIVGRNSEQKRSKEIPLQQYLEIRYEDLVTQPEVIMKKVISFIDEDWSPDLADFQGQSEDYEKVLTIAGRESSTLKRLQTPLSKGRLNIWQETLTQEDLSAIEDAVTERGYYDLYRQIISENPAGL